MINVTEMYTCKQMYW